MQNEKNTQLQNLIPHFSLSEKKNFPLFFAENSAEDCVLWLCATLYNNEQENHLQCYDWLITFLPFCFSENATHPLVLARFHYALLQTKIDILAKIKRIQNKSEKEYILLCIKQLQDSSFFISEKNIQLFSELNAILQSNSLLIPFVQKQNSLFQSSIKTIQGSVKKTIFSKNTEYLLDNPHYALQQNITELFTNLENTINTSLKKEAKEKILSDLTAYKKTLIPQKFHITIVGEGKRGKSSIINALMQGIYSPIEETAPKTAVPIEFYYAPKEEFFAQYLSKEQSQKQQELFPNIKTTLSYDKKFPINKEEILAYTAENGKFTHNIGKVYVGLPHELLKQDFILSDTPGLNSLNPFHDYLTKEQALQADCILFVMDARKPDSASELQFLEHIAKKGRTLSIIGILTGIDRLNEEESLAKALFQAKTLLEKSIAQVNFVSLLDIIPLNAKELMAHYCENKSITKNSHKNFKLLVDTIRSALKTKSNSTQYELKITQNAYNLLENINKTLITAEQSFLPENIVSLLESHAKNLILATQNYATQAKQLLESVEKDINAWQQNLEIDLNTFESLFINTLQNAMFEYAETLGKNIAKKKAWEDFDQNKAKQIAEQLVNSCLQKQEISLKIWEEKIRIFEKELQVISTNCLETLQNTIHSLGDTTIPDTSLQHILIQGNIKLKQLSLFLAGAGSGFALSASFFNLVTVGSIALALLGDPISISGLVLTGLGAITLHYKGNFEQQKNAILAKKQAKIENWAKNIKNVIEEHLQEKQQELIEQYTIRVQKSFIPPFELLVSESMHIYWYTEFIRSLQQEAKNNQNRLSDKLHNATLLLETYKNIYIENE